MNANQNKAKANAKANAKTIVKSYICKDITKHPEYEKIMKIKDKKIQDRMIKCLKNKFKDGFDIRPFFQKFAENTEYHIVKIETRTKKDSEETYRILYDNNGLKYYSKAKIDKYIEENNIPDEIPNTEEHSFIIQTSSEDFFINKEGNPVFYIPIEPIYINMENLGNNDENNEEPNEEDYLN